MIGDFLVGRVAPKFLLESAYGIFQIRKFVALVTRQDIVFTAAVVDGSGYPESGIGLKVEPRARLVAFHGIEQAHHAVLDQVIELDVRRQTGCNLIGQAANEWRVLNNRAM